MKMMIHEVLGCSMFSETQTNSQCTANFRENSQSLLWKDPGMYNSKIILDRLTVCLSRLTAGAHQLHQHESAKVPSAAFSVAPTPRAVGRTGPTLPWKSLVRHVRQPKLV
jgi:hypothetical protein